MKKSTLLLIIGSIMMMGFVFLSTTHIIYNTDQDIEPDSSYRRSINYGDSLPFYAINSTAGQQSINGIDASNSGGSVSVSSVGANMSSISAYSNGGVIGAGLNNTQSGNSGNSVLSVSTPHSISLIGLSAIDNTATYNSSINITSGTQTTSFSGVRINISGSSLAARFLYTEANSLPHRGIEYQATGYVTQLHSLTDKEYVDQNFLLVYNLTTLPAITPLTPSKMILVTNGSTSGGPCLAYCYNGNWKRVSDNVNL